MTVAITAYPAGLAGATSQRNPTGKAKAANSVRRNSVTITNGGNAAGIVGATPTLAATSGGISSKKMNTAPVKRTELGTTTLKSGDFGVMPIDDNIKGINSNNGLGNRVSQVKHRFRKDVDRKYHPEIVAVSDDGWDYRSQQLKELENTNYGPDLLGGTGITTATFAGTGAISGGKATLNQNETLTFSADSVDNTTYDLIVYTNSDVNITVDGVDDDSAAITFVTPLNVETSVDGRMILRYAGSGGDDFTITNPNAADLVITNVEIRAIIATNINITFGEDNTTKVSYANGRIPVNVSR